MALLQAIREHGSLVAAARSLDLPHRTAWQRVHEMEERLGVKLLDTASGGASGGTSRLTPVAEELVFRYDAFRAGFEDELAHRFRTHFANLSI